MDTEFNISLISFYKNCCFTIKNIIEDHCESTTFVSACIIRRWCEVEILLANQKGHPNLMQYLKKSTCIFLIVIVKIVCKCKEK